MSQRWLLPEQIEDLLPPFAWQLENEKNKLLGIFRGYGYELVSPPALEYMDSLLTGTGQAADLITFKVVDQLSGKLMGLRADITPQVARIDAHRLDSQGIRRLCYAGHVYHALAGGVGQSREPFQVGAELYGYAGLDADLEVQAMLVDALQALALQEFVLDLGHVGIFRALAEGLSPEIEQALMSALQGKNSPLIEALTASCDPVQRDALRALPNLCGGLETIERARAILPSHALILRGLEDLELAVSRLSTRASVGIDLSELRGYDYHTGMVFSVYAKGFPGAVARGGRYDSIGAAFGRARPATGFSIDLRDLLCVLPTPKPIQKVWLPRSVAANLSGDRLAKELGVLRKAGLVVISELAHVADDDAAAVSPGVSGAAGAGTSNAVAQITGVHPDCDFVLLLGPDGLEARPLSDIQENFIMESDAS